MAVSRLSSFPEHPPGPKVITHLFEVDEVNWIKSMKSMECLKSISLIKYNDFSQVNEVHKVHKVHQVDQEKQEQGCDLGAGGLGRKIYSPFTRQKWGVDFWVGFGHKNCCPGSFLRYWTG